MVAATIPLGYEALPNSNEIALQDASKSFSDSKR
jgi:hypothetical protein